MAALAKSLMVLAALLALYIITIWIKPHVIAHILDLFDDNDL